MSRRPPSDTFTRFTSTSPHASQNPATINSTNSGARSSPSQSPRILFGSGGSDGETAQQKVARLRAAARAQKARGSMSVTERVIDNGRIWADRMHRMSTYGLIGFTGLATAVALYGATDLVLHTRRQKRAFVDREVGKLRDAQQAFLRGEADAEQLYLLEQERAAEDISAISKRHKEIQKKETYWTRFKGFLGTGAAAGEKGEEGPTLHQPQDLERLRREKSLEDARFESELRPVAIAESGIRGVGVDEKGRPVPANKMQRVMHPVKESEAFQRAGHSGGPLDIMADNAANAVGESGSRDWLSWFRGGKR